MSESKKIIILEDTTKDKDNVNLEEMNKILDEVQYESQILKKIKFNNVDDQFIFDNIMLSDKQKEKFIYDFFITNKDKFN